MDNTPSDPSETRPTDPDLKWTGWALDMLRDMIEIDCRTKRMTALQQGQILAGPDAPDYALMQSRIARSIRLCVAMTERIREAYRARKAAAEKAAAEIQERRQRRRAQVARAVAEALGPERPAGDGAKGVGGLAAEPRESLTETEVPDVELDTLPIDEIVLRISRRLGREPGRLPQGWDDVVARDEAAEPLDETLSETLSETLADPPSEAPEPGEAAPPGRKPPQSDTS